MPDICLNKLEEWWEEAKADRDYLGCAKILRSQLNLLKCEEDGLRSGSRSLEDKVVFLEMAVAEMDVKDALSVIGHIRYARKTLSISSGECGSAFKREISAKERAQIRKRNRPPVLSIQNREKLGPDYAVGPPSDVLQPDVLGNGGKRLA